MIDFEKELKEVLEKNGTFDSAKSETLGKEIVQMWADKNLHRAQLAFWIFFLASIGMMVGGYIGLSLATNTKGMLGWVIFFMIGFNSTILMKLWYWIVDTKFKILEEIKQLQLQIAEQVGKKG
jgi:MFS family permease